MTLRFDIVNLFDYGGGIGVLRRNSARVADTSRAFPRNFERRITQPLCRRDGHEKADRRAKPKSHVMWAKSAYRSADARCRARCDGVAACRSRCRDARDRGRVLTRAPASEETPLFRGAFLSQYPSQHFDEQKHKRPEQSSSLEQSRSRQVTVMFSDLVGSTSALGTHGP
jgi:hypothetical protein